MPKARGKNLGYEEAVEVKNFTFGEEKAVFDWEGSQGMESLKVRALQASISALDRRLSIVWRSFLILSTVSICAVVFAIVALYIAMASSSGGDYHLQSRSDRTNTAQAVNGFPQHPMKHEKNFSLFASEIKAIQQQQKEILSFISSELNRTSHMLRAETNTREQGLGMLSFQLNSTRADFVQLVESTNRTLNKKLQKEINRSRGLNDTWSERFDSLETKTISGLQSQGKKVEEENLMLSLLSRELNRTSHMLRAETNAREQELNTLSFQLNSTKADFVQLVETTNRTLNKKRKERLASLETEIISRLQSQEKKFNQLQDQQMQANASISALKEVSLFYLKLLV